jgi:hypothetical protein
MSLTAVARKHLRDSRRTGNLSLANAELEAVPAAVWNPRDHLEADERLYECVDLVKLDLNYNSISQLPEELGALGSSLVVLQASHNPLATLPQCLQDFGLLKMLNLSSCRLAHLPPQVGALSALVELRLDHNAIAELPADSITGLGELQVLQLEHNLLTTLPHALGRLSKMVRALAGEQCPWREGVGLVVRDRVSACCACKNGGGSGWGHLLGSSCLCPAIGPVAPVAEQAHDTARVPGRTVAVRSAGVA